MRLPRGIRNRNGGNIRVAPHFNWQGELKLPQSDPRYDPEFCVFDEAVNGIRAMMKLLINYNQKHKIKTIRGIVGRYAPPNENNVNSYIDSIVKKTDIPPDQEWDFTKLEFLVPVTKAMIVHENGHPLKAIGKDYKEQGYTDNWYSDRTYQEAYELAVKGRIVSHTMNSLPEAEEVKLTWWQRLVKFFKGEKV